MRLLTLGPFSMIALRPAPPLLTTDCTKASVLAQKVARCGRHQNRGSYKCGFPFFLPLLDDDDHDDDDEATICVGTKMMIKPNREVLRNLYPTVRVPYVFFCRFFSSLDNIGMRNKKTCCLTRFCQ